MNRNVYNAPVYSIILNGVHNADILNDADILKVVYFFSETLTFQYF